MAKRAINQTTGITDTLQTTGVNYPNLGYSQGDLSNVKVEPADTFITFNDPDTKVAFNFSEDEDDEPLVMTARDFKRIIKFAKELMEEEHPDLKL